MSATMFHTHTKPRAKYIHIHIFKNHAALKRPVQSALLVLAPTEHMALGEGRRCNRKGENVRQICQSQNFSPAVIYLSVTLT